MATSEPLLPPGWRRRRTGNALVATAPASAGRLPALIAWRTGSTPAYVAVDVEDEDVIEIDGHTVGYRRLGHRIGDVEVVSEEWTWPDGDGHVLIATVARADYLDVCDLFEEVALSVVPVS